MVHVTVLWYQAISKSTTAWLYTIVWAKLCCSYKYADSCLLHLVPFPQRFSKLVDSPHVFQGAGGTNWSTWTSIEVPCQGHEGSDAHRPGISKLTSRPSSAISRGYVFLCPWLPKSPTGRCSTLKGTIMTLTEIDWNHWNPYLPTFSNWVTLFPKIPPNPLAVPRIFQRSWLERSLRQTLWHGRVFRWSCISCPKPGGLNISRKWTWQKPDGLNISLFLKKKWGWEVETFLRQVGSTLMKGINHHDRSSSRETVPSLIQNVNKYPTASDDHLSILNLAWIDHIDN